ncbi:MAG: two-component sensor histidine kinase [Methylomonas sp.]|nr:MAG: two-component sensor histidine kinase [Methylomonas sp.]
MHKSIRFKLFLTFLLTTLLVVAGMHLFMRWSLDKGFNEWVESRQRDRVENLLDNLSAVYTDSGNSWQPLGSNKRQWVQLLLQSDNHRHRHPQPWMRFALAGPTNQWPPEPADFEDKPMRRLLPLELRAMLLAADKSIVFGRQELLSRLTLYPVQQSDQVVGYLGLLPGRPDNQSGDLRFLQQQAQAFGWIALVMVMLSAALALLLAYMLGKPIKRMTVAAKQLAVGDYAVRLPTDSKDELGQLARDFNDMAAALEQAEQSRRRWVADISHELRTPLSVLRGELEALQDGIRPMVPAAVDSLLTDVMRLNRLVDDLYQLALSDQGALTYRKTLIDPVAVLKADLAAFQAEFAAKSIAIEWLDQTQLIVSLHGDADRLSQLFRNLLKNSLKYTDAGGRMKIIVSTTANTLLITLADSAPGVAVAEQEKLFERFYRLDSSRSRHHGGAGLGLSICRNIVAAHQGQISAQSSELGGLAILIELPLRA